MQVDNELVKETKHTSARNEDDISITTTLTNPGQLNVIRRNGAVTPYDDNKIIVAMTKAFLATEGGLAAKSSRVHEIVSELTAQITQAFNYRLQGSGTLHIEDIQDQVELALMRHGHQKVARSYVLYREERRKLREDKHADLGEDDGGSAGGSIQAVLPNGGKILLSNDFLQAIIKDAAANLQHVDENLILQETIRNLYQGVPIADVSKALIMTARTKIESEPDYSFAAARLLLATLRDEAFQFLKLAKCEFNYELQSRYKEYFQAYIQRGIELELLDPALNQFDLAQLGEALQLENDMQFSYLGLQTLYDRYFIHSNEIRFELPQAFFMRVAMGLAINEDDKNKRAIEFYQLLASFDFMSSTPTLFNSGTTRPQLSSCFLTTVPDDLDGIYSALKDNALLSKFAGGLGNDWTPVRAMGAKIKGTNGKSLGVVPFLNVANASAVAVNQGGKRKGAVCAYLETWHLDIEEFLELRKNTGDDRRRTHDMNTANWIPDLFMQRVFSDDEWTLFSPDEATDLHDCYGEEFRQTYENYERMAEHGLIKNYKKIKALNLWRKMLSLLFETGHPWLTFKDPCNIRSPQQHMGIIHSSNLCTEITLNTSENEIAVCNLGSINLPAHIDNDGLNLAKLEKTVNTAIRMLDNVIDINYYTVPQARRSNLKHRPIGLGVMGFQDALYKQGIAYSSDDAIEFADTSMEAISYYAIKASTNLAEKRGSYESFEGSLWSQGIMPIDSIELLQQQRGEYLTQDKSMRMDWDSLRTRVRTVGMRNSNVLAIAPTATISNICGVTQSIEPTFQNLFVKSNLSGEFTIVNPYLVAELKAIDLWDEVMVNDLKYFDGSVQKINRIPEAIKLRYRSAFEVEPKWLVECASRRQKWIDQSQSLNLYIAQPSGKKLDTLYRMAWLRGLKTTYYLRSMGATNTEKATIHDGALNAVKVKACAIDDPDCEACQ